MVVPQVLWLFLKFMVDAVLAVFHRVKAAVARAAALKGALNALDSLAAIGTS